MKDSALKIVKEFLQKYHQKGPLCLAISGGSDSLALMHLLLSCRRFFTFDLHLAHVDHCWRNESENEAKVLQSMAKEHQLPFHLKKLNAKHPSSNLEDYFRKERYRYFHTLQEKHQFQALILAHHADDQAETVIKRVLEGASLSRLGGLKPVRRQQDLTLWRPLLKMNKEEILSWLEKKGLKGFDDLTNKDTYYLRARMRHEIFPQLEKKFGKKIGKNLCLFGEHFQDLGDYLDRKIEPLFKKLEKTSFGAYIQLSHLEKLEISHFIKRICEKNGEMISREALQTLTQLIQKRASDKWVNAGPLRFYLRKGVLFLVFHNVNSDITLTIKKIVEEIGVLENEKIYLEKKPLNRVILTV